MISSTRIQQYYNDLYKCLRNYLWEYRVVKEICDLELACYQALPNLNDIKYALRRVKQFAINILIEDEELKESFETFENFIAEEDDVYVRIKFTEDVVK